jgi:dTDP-4-amino-4,6-dideoxygalactose transaminase
MQVPFLNLTAQYQTIKGEIALALQKVLDTSAFAGGPAVERFEQAFASYCQTGHAIGCGSGSDALWMALFGLGIGPGDAVITTPNTFIATAEAVSLCGATPIFVDSNEYYHLDPVKLEALLSSMSNELRARLKAVVPVHLYGQPADMDAILSIAEKYNLSVIEDACQAHGATYKGKRAGSMGDAGCFSFYPGKNLGAYGEAGAVVTNNTDLTQKIKMFRDHGQSKKYHHAMVGWNARMDGFQGAVLNVKMKYIEDWTRKRQKNAAFYTELLSGNDGIETPKILDGAESVFHLYVIQTNKRDELQHYLKDHGIDTGLHYPNPLHLQEAYRHLGYGTGAFPVAERAAKRILSLPMYPELNEEQIQYVCGKIKDFICHGHTQKHTDG